MEHSNTLNLDLPANNAESLIYGPVMNTGKRRELAHRAFHESGLAEYLTSLGWIVPVTYNSFGRNGFTFADLGLAAILAQEFLVYRPYCVCGFQAVINFQALEACIIAMGNILPAYQRLVCSEDDTAFARPVDRERYSELVKTLLVILQRSDGNTISGAALTDTLAELRRLTTSECLGGMARTLELENEVSLRLLFQLVLFVGSRFL